MSAHASSVCFVGVLRPGKIYVMVVGALRADIWGHIKTATDLRQRTLMVILQVLQIMVLAAWFPSEAAL